MKSLLRRHFKPITLTAFAWLGTLLAGFQAVFQIFLHPSDAGGKSAGKPFLLSAASCLRKNGSAVWRSHTCGMTQREHPLQSCNYLSLRGRCAAKGQRVTGKTLPASNNRSSIGTASRPRSCLPLWGRRRARPVGDKASRKPAERGGERPQCGMKRTGSVLSKGASEAQLKRATIAKLTEAPKAQDGGTAAGRDG